MRWQSIVRSFLAASLVMAVGLCHDSRAADSGSELGVPVKAEAEKAGAVHEDESEHIGHGNASPNLENPVDPKADLAIATLAVFLALLAALWKFAWGPIAAGLEKREHAIDESIAAAKRANEESKLLQAEHQRKLAGAADEVREIVEAARRDAETTKQEILAEARAAGNAERERAVLEIDRATDRALKELSERSADIAVALAGKIVRSKLTSGEHAQLVQEALAKFPQSAAGSNN